jgi:glutathione S-transferase
VGLLDSFEKGLERAVNGAFAKTFKSGLQPVEITAALRRELDTKAAVVSRDRILVPNKFSVRLSRVDYEHMSGLGQTLIDELTRLVQQHATAQHYSFPGGIAITLTEDPTLSTGMIDVKSVNVKGTVSWTPVLDINGIRILETSAIARYLNDVLPGKLLVPGTPEERARMDMVIGMLDSYGYGALLGGVAAYHLFPDFVGGKNESMRQGGLETGRKLIEFAMKTKGDSRFIAGELSLADLYLAPVLSYISLTPDAPALFDVEGFADWWARVQQLESFKATQPNLG